VWLMLNLTTLTWARFAAWLVLGVIVYFAYGRRHSRVGRGEDASADAGVGTSAASGVERP